LNSITSLYPKIKDKIIRVPEGVDKMFYKRNYDEVINIKRKYILNENDDYLIFISTIQPRKNIPTMIQGFSKLVKNNERYKDLKLLIAGKKGWNFDESLNAPEKYNVAENVRFIGRIDDSEIPPLLSGAKAFINMSLQEGFSLTALEAMACSCPLILSDIEAHHEISGSYGNYANPTDPENISFVIQNVLDDPDFKKVESALYAARTYTWESAAQKTLDLFIKTYENR
jgi:glycosyltransferase involved in cell wall biosynthesis